MLLLFLVSLILVAGIFYVDEGACSFDSLRKFRNVLSLLGFATFFSIFPIGVYNIVSESKHKRFAIIFSALGYIPLITYICLPLIFQVLR